MSSEEEYLPIPKLAPNKTAPFVFPPIESALTEKDGANGLLCFGGDLQPERLITAYQNGIFPWYSKGEPILWWSPDPRAILVLDKLHISHSLHKHLKKPNYVVHTDQQFKAIMRHCGESRAETWIDTAMVEAYCQLFNLGYAHSIEVYEKDKTEQQKPPSSGLKLIGGLYGVAIGKAFFGESMFSLETDASKIALVALTQILKEKGFMVLDCQMQTPHLQSLGVQTIPRAQYLELVRLATAEKAPQRSSKLATKLTHWDICWHFNQNSAT